MNRAQQNLLQVKGRNMSLLSRLVDHVLQQLPYISRNPDSVGRILTQQTPVQHLPL